MWVSGPHAHPAPVGAPAEVPLGAHWLVVWVSGPRQARRSTSRREHLALTVGKRETPRGYLVPAAQPATRRQAGVPVNTTDRGYPVLSDRDGLGSPLKEAGVFERGYLVLKCVGLSDSVSSNGRGRSTRLWKTRRPSVVAFLSVRRSATGEGYRKHYRGSRSSEVASAR
jgi:hypothetical protein